jgi:site-specific recombinase XerD
VRLKGQTGSRLDADLLTNDEIEQLMKFCSRRAPTGVRNRALIAVCWRCGLRIGEALALAVKDFDPDSGTLVVQRGKGGKRRVVGVDAGTVALVGRWLEVRRKRGISNGSPLFCSLAGRPVDQSYVRHLLPRLARKAGIERRVHAHGLRHAFAVDLVRSGAPLYVVRDALGHASIATTQVYLSRVGAHEAVEAMRNREWHGP